MTHPEDLARLYRPESGIGTPDSHDIEFSRLKADFDEALKEVRRLRQELALALQGNQPKETK